MCVCVCGRGGGGGGEVVVVVVVCVCVCVVWCGVCGVCMLCMLCICVCVCVCVCGVWCVCMLYICVCVYMCVCILPVINDQILALFAAGTEKLSESIRSISRVNAMWGKTSCKINLQTSKGGQMDHHWFLRVNKNKSFKSIKTKLSVPVSPIMSASLDVIWMTSSLIICA